MIKTIDAWQSVGKGETLFENIISGRFSRYGPRRYPYKCVLVRVFKGKTLEKSKEILKLIIVPGILPAGILGGYVNTRLAENRVPSRRLVGNVNGKFYVPG